MPNFRVGSFASHPAVRDLQWGTKPGGETVSAARARAMSTRLGRELCRDLRYSIRRRKVGLAAVPTSEETYMNDVATILAVRTRLKQRTLPQGALWRRVGEYAGGGVCAGCGKRITSAQASYAVDFTPGITPESVRFHRVCFEIWECECQTDPSK